MSIEKRVVTLARTLNLFTSTRAIDIKVLKDLRDVFPQRGQWRGTGPRELPVDRSMARDRPSPYVKGKAFFLP